MGRCLYLREGCLFPGDDSAEVLESLRQNRDFRRRFFRQSRPKKRENAQRMHIKHSLGMRTVLRRGFRFWLRLSSRRRCPRDTGVLLPRTILPHGLSLTFPYLLPGIIDHIQQCIADAGSNITSSLSSFGHDVRHICLHDQFF